MKTMMAAAPIPSEIAPVRTASAPSSAETVRCSSTVSGAGKAPERSSSASSLALSWVKLPPSITPEPPVIAVLITGAEIHWLSSTMAKRLPMFSAGAWPKRLAPRPLKRKATCGSLFWPNTWLADTRSSPDTTMRFFSVRSSGPLADFMIMSPAGAGGGGRPGVRGGAASSTIWKLSLAVLPMMARSLSGSLSPGASTTIRAAPWRMMVGSRVPSWSTRRRITSMDWSTARAADIWS